MEGIGHMGEINWGQVSRYVSAMVFKVVNRSEKREFTYSVE